MRDARHAGLDVDLPDRLSAIAVPIRRRGRIVACINCVWLLDAADEREIVERYLPALRRAASKIAIRPAR